MANTNDIPPYASPGSEDPVVKHKLTAPIPAINGGEAGNFNPSNQFKESCSPSLYLPSSLVSSTSIADNVRDRSIQAARAAEAEAEAILRGDRIPVDLLEELPGLGFKEHKMVTLLCNGGYYPLFLASDSPVLLAALKEEVSSLMIRKGCRPVILRKTSASDGLGYVVCSESELAEYGVHLSDSGWACITRGISFGNAIVVRLSHDDPTGKLPFMSVNGSYSDAQKRMLLNSYQYEMSEHGSLMVTSEDGIKWTVIAEGLKLMMFAPPSPPWFQVTSSAVPDRLAFISAKVMKVLFYPFYWAGVILSSAGEKVDAQIAATITSVFGVGISRSTAHMSPLDYVKIGAYASSCVLIFCSQMLKPIGSPATSAKAKRSNELSNLMAGGAIVCTALGIFCNIFSPLSLPYAISGISMCVVLVLLAALYGSFSR